MDGLNSTFIPMEVGMTSVWPDIMSNHSPNITSKGHEVPVSITTVVTAVIFIIVFIVGLLGNTLVIYVVVRYTKMKTVTNLYILNLALADELYILGIPFLGTHNVLSYWPYGEFLCKMYMTADTMSQFSSTFCLTVMSIDRYLAVVHPMKSAKWRKTQLAKVINGMIWLVSFLIILPATIFSKIQEEFQSCNMTWPEPSNLWSSVFILYTSILGFFLPVVVICLCYLLLVIKVRSAGLRAGLTKRRKSERKVTRMVVIIVLVFVLCWLPFFTMNIVNLVHIIPENNVNTAIYFFFVILTYVNSCANPFLYGFLSDNFKQSFQKALCLIKANAVNTTQTTTQDRTKESKVPNSSPRSHTQNGKLQNIQQHVQMEVLESETLKSSML